MGWRISGELAAQGEFDVLDDGTGRQLEHVCEMDAGTEVHIVDDAGFDVVEMAVLGEIRAEARRLAVEVDLADDAMLTIASRQVYTVASDILGSVSLIRMNTSLAVG